MKERNPIHFPGTAYVREKQLFTLLRQYLLGLNSMTVLSEPLFVSNSIVVNLVPMTNTLWNRRMYLPGLLLVFNTFVPLDSAPLYA